MAAPQMDRGMPAVVTLPAEIDLTNAEEVFDRICAAIEPGSATVIADMTATAFCDSSGARHLCWLTGEPARPDAAAVRRPCRPPVRRILAFTGADQVMAVYPALREAVSGGPSPAQPGSLEGATEEPPAHPMAT